ncbi:hypothetical protein AMTR_s00117p00043370 [Amborella trichopoda]|uniref:Uncharacterized protein n=1 Tax=Amborella trichopoda TaxID=13333 RepID=W1NSV1_AMBTC|nr:hypothetical protein AMTR_s00117p00043370 [Amborella trichopoda]
MVPKLLRSSNAGDEMKLSNKSIEALKGHQRYQKKEQEQLHTFVTPGEDKWDSRRRSPRPLMFQEQSSGHAKFCPTPGDPRGASKQLVIQKFRKQSLGPSHSSPPSSGHLVPIHVCDCNSFLHHNNLPRTFNFHGFRHFILLPNDLHPPIRLLGPITRPRREVLRKFRKQSLGLSHASPPSLGRLVPVQICDYKSFLHHNKLPRTFHFHGFKNFLLLPNDLHPPIQLLGPVPRLRRDVFFLREGFSHWYGRDTRAGGQKETLGEDVPR